MRNVLVTGGAGFIGSHLVDLLIEDGCGVTVVDSLEPQVHTEPPKYLNPDARYFFDRVASSRVPYSSFLPSVDTVFYYASKVGPAQSMEEIADYTECNIANVGFFLQTLLTHGRSVKRVIFSGSMGPYGEGSYRCRHCSLEFVPTDIRTSMEFCCPDCGGDAANQPLDENTPISNISYYGLSKNVQEEMFRLFARTHELEFVSLRFFSVYGPRQAFGNPYAGPIPIWIERAGQGKDLLVFEDGNQTRDFIHVKDIAKISRDAGVADLDMPVVVVNCGTGHATKILDVAEFIRQRTGTPGQVVVTGELRTGDLRHSLANNAKLGEFLEFREFTSVWDGLAELTEQFGTSGQAGDKVER